MTSAEPTAHRLPTSPAVSRSAPPQPRPIGRIPVQDVAPVVSCGAFPTKSVVGEDVPVSATVFREGHEVVNASVVVTDPDGQRTLHPMRCDNPGLDHWVGTISADRPGRWSFRVEGWSDPFGTWVYGANIKVGAGIDTELVFEEGARVLERAVAEVSRPETEQAVLRRAIETLRDTNCTDAQRLEAGTGQATREVLQRTPLRDGVTPTAPVAWLVERERALAGAWYEIFPRSEGAHFDEATQTWTSGTFATASKRLPAIADMGFDVVYLTPVHPIGEVNRKGPNNSLAAGPADPGSPYAIGSKEGGHDALHPDLGNWDDFDEFVDAAEQLGLEVALDLALQAAPDHPWVTSHPQFFTTRADGTIAYAENPPKKYQDIYPLNFDNDPDGIYAEIRRVVQVWIDHGVKIFRVDNPHTKPLEFWQWLIADVATQHPDVIWLAEAFTRPAMMHTLAKIGFQQSYTYFTWRNEARELQEYVEDLAGESAAYMRPSFWPTTHDILTPFLQYGGPTAWKLRAAIAATIVPTYGIYAGYELQESVARPGVEEQIDNEKYQFKDRRWADYEPGGAKEGQSLAPYLKQLNAIRAAHPSLAWLRTITFHPCDDPAFIAYSKKRGDDVVIVVAATDPHATRESTVHFDLTALGLEAGTEFIAHDEITDQTWRWGQDVYVRLGIDTEPVHIIDVRRA